MTENHYAREVVVSYKGPRRKAPAVTSSRTVDAFVRSTLKIQDDLTESFWALLLDAKNRIIGYHRVSQGSVSACPVAASDIMRVVLLSGAVGWIAVHNHPSGDPTPSSDDVMLTERLAQVSTLLGLRMVDHVIVGSPVAPSDAAYFSFLDAGLLKVVRS